MRCKIRYVEELNFWQNFLETKQGHILIRLKRYIIDLTKIKLNKSITELYVI